MSLKELLLEYLILNKKLYRQELSKLVKKWQYEKSNAERRLRELCEEYPIKRYDIDNKEVLGSSWICYWQIGKIKKSLILK